MHLRRLAFPAFLLAGSVCLTPNVHADTTIDFENLSQGTFVTNQYQAEGVTFTGARIAPSTYNSVGYPPHSGTNVVYNSDLSGILQANAVGPLWDSVSLYYTAGIDNLGNPVTAYLDAFDMSGNLLKRTSGPSNFGTNALLSVSAANIAYVQFHDSGNFLTMDDFTFHQQSSQQSSSVPELSTSLIFGGFVALGGLVAFRRRKSSRAAA